MKIKFACVDSKNIERRVSEFIPVQLTKTSTYIRDRPCIKFKILYDDVILYALQSLYAMGMESYLCKGVIKKGVILMIYINFI